MKVCVKICVILMGVFLCSFMQNASASDTSSLTGLRVGEDDDVVIKIQQCAIRPDEYCGYLVGFKPEKKDLLNRALCGTRIIGGLRAHEGRLTDGWISDIENDKIYNAHVFMIQNTMPKFSVLGVKVFAKNEMLSETLIWMKFKKPNKISGLKMCVHDAAP